MQEICNSGRASTRTPSWRKHSPSAFENAKWAYTPLGVAIKMKRERRPLTHAAGSSAIGLQAFCIPALLPSSARLVWATAIWAMLLDEKTECFCLPLPATSPSRPLKARSDRSERQQGPKSPCVLSSMAWARMLRSSSAGSTASPMCRPNTTSSGREECALHRQREGLFQRRAREVPLLRRGRRSARALPSCSTRT